MLASHVIAQATSVINSKNKSNTCGFIISLSKINEPILVLTCDNIVDANFKNFIDEFVNKNINIVCWCQPSQLKILKAIT